MAASKAILHSILLFLCISIFIVHGRILKLNSSDIDDELLISDGVDHHRHDWSQSSGECDHHHDGSSKSTALRAATCDHQYGFLPCAENILGYLFLVIVYQLLLILVDGHIARGSKELFNIIGETKIGVVIFRFLMALPPTIFMILSGIFSSKENAQSTVSAGVGIFAGITVFTLTFQWSIILICGSRKLKGKPDVQAKHSTSSCLPGRVQLIKLKDNGVKIHEWTRETGGIMLLSLIPYAIVQLGNIFQTSSANRVITTVALIVSVLSVASYFLYQIKSTLMQESSLAYVKYDILKERFLDHIQLDGRFLTKDGKVNTDAIYNVFAKADTNQDKCLTKDEVGKLVRDLNKSENEEVIKFIVERIMREFDKDNDGLITEEEFVEGCINLSKNIPKSSQHSESSLDPIESGKTHDEEEFAVKERTTNFDLDNSGLINEEEYIEYGWLNWLDDIQMSSQHSESSLDPIENGKMHDEEDFAVKERMTNFDLDSSGSINEKEYEKEYRDAWMNWLNDIQKSSQHGDSSFEKAVHEVVQSIKQENRDEDPAEIHRIMTTILTQAKTLELKSKSLIKEDGKPDDEIIKSLFVQFDRDGNKSISKSELQEFISLFNQFDRDGNRSISKSEVQEFISDVDFGEIHLKPEEIVNIIFKNFDVNNDGKIDESEFVNGIIKSVIAWKKLPYDKRILVKSLIRVILGVVMMTLLGGPLINNILSLSYAIGLPPFGTSFVIGPITMSIRALLTAIVPAKEKDKSSASLAFSQIYNSVIMNNIMGLTSLLFIVYFKELMWDFSAEVLTILFVCAIMGVMAYKCDSYPLWTCILAVLYPVSLGFYYVAQVFWGWN